MNRLISTLKKNGFDISSEVGALKLNFLISQLVIALLLINETKFLIDSVSSVLLKQMVVLGLAIMLVVSCFSIGYRSKEP